MLPTLLITLIFSYFIYAIHKLDLHRQALEALCKPVGEWFGEAGNPVRAALWVGAIVLSLASWLSPANTLFNQMLPDFISISIAVIVIDELVQYRNELQRKQEIFEQIESPVRDVAVEAVRLARKYGWLNEVLQKAALVGAQLAGANLEETNLQGKDLQESDLYKANLKKANLQGAHLYKANLQEAVLLTANLREASLLSANLRKVFMQVADLQETDLVQANLQGAAIGYSNLQGALLTKANLQDVSLWKADLRGADLRGADLRGADLQEADLRGTVYDKHTKWPDGFDPEAAGARKVAG